MNQEHSKKPGPSGGEYSTQPSRAPRQDESTPDAPDPDAGTTANPYHPDEQQGISNRPSKEEHAFPDAESPTDADRGDVRLTDPVQRGGNRGGV